MHTSLTNILTKHTQTLLPLYSVTLATMARNCCYTLLSAMVLNACEIQTHARAHTHTHTYVHIYIL